jgi:hypothetical protein
MAKKRIFNTDLCWLISEELDFGKRQTRAAFAVVPDEKDGWRVIISIRGRRYLTAADEQRLADVQQKLRLRYELMP